MIRVEEMEIQNRLHAGDGTALELLFHRYYNDLCRYLIVFLKDENAAKNIVQDLFMHLWEHRERIDFKKSLESYLYQACRFNALIYLRNKNRHEKCHEDIKNEYVESFDASTEMEIKELNRIINESIDLLPARCQLIFRLSRTRGLSYHEIATQLGISVSAVENQVNIAIKKVKRHINNYYTNIYIAGFLL
ncbi:MAG: RNA polymerase sigma-70 factor [Bacteroidota bacterium]|nr:RNA polymerase sigma-70 factor [Bacteroidota bacterium]MDP4289938.1 RNA polymerase sigma-70 factor [Bacteroidota bacterium]